MHSADEKIGTVKVVIVWILKKINKSYKRFAIFEHEILHLSGKKSVKISINPKKVKFNIDKIAKMLYNR